MRSNFDPVSTIGLKVQLEYDINAPLHVRIERESADDIIMSGDIFACVTHTLQNYPLSMLSRPEIPVKVWAAAFVVGFNLEVTPFLPEF